MIDQKEKQLDELENYKGKWRNLYIFENGQNIGRGIFDTEQEAKQAVDDYLLAIGGNMSGFHVSMEGRIYLNLITVLQIPVSE